MRKVTATDLARGALSAAASVIPRAMNDEFEGHQKLVIRAGDRTVRVTVRVKYDLDGEEVNLK